ncbi:hypothetical protein [Membranihabitans marinus]|uniref:hypothetical protein n=1 Tax=Membranihabitans marinus TaxID=1227546 RepID=UPI001F270A0F|nr:hypothetical protein [Membranihabitans marinus]
MIRDRSKRLSTYYFPRNLPRFSLDIYDYCTFDQTSFYYKKESFRSLVLDLEAREEELLASYQYRVRRYVKRSKDMDFRIEVHRDGRPFYYLQDSVVRQNQAVDYYPMEMLSPAHHRLFTTIQHSEMGVLAMHGHLMDAENQVVLLSMNISNYRQFIRPEDRQMAGMANTYLFHCDFLRFQSMDYKVYDMGGYENPSLMQFKKGFGGQIVHYFRYKPKPVIFAKKIMKGLKGKK